MASFELECDRLSHVVDDIQFERLRWARTEGPMLARLVELAHDALEGRDDFELIDEGSTSAVKRFVVKVHSNRIIAIVMGLDSGCAIIGAEAIERSKYRVSDDSPVFTEFAGVNEAWMAGALQQLFSRVHS
jgi:hypothetical protein